MELVPVHIHPSLNPTRSNTEMLESWIPHFGAGSGSNKSLPNLIQTNTEMLEFWIPSLFLNFLRARNAKKKTVAAPKL